MTGARAISLTAATNLADDKTMPRRYIARSARAIKFVVVLVVLAGWIANARAQNITEYPVPTRASGLNGIAARPTARSGLLKAMPARSGASRLRALSQNIRFAAGERA
jgi:hypothetical protein